MRKIPSNAPLAFIAIGRCLLVTGEFAAAAKYDEEGLHSSSTLHVGGGGEVPLRMVLVQSLRRAGEHERAASEQVLLDQLIAKRLEESTDPLLRDTF